MITIPHQLIDVGAKFILVRSLGKEAIETEWQNNFYESTSQKLIEHINNNGNYGVISGNTGICIIDIDIPEEFKKGDFGLPDSFTITRGEKESFHYYFRCPDCPEDMKRKFETGFGDIRLGGNNYVVGPRCFAPTRADPKRILEYKIHRDTSIQNIPYEKILPIIQGKVSTNTAIAHRAPFVAPEKAVNRHYFFRSIVANGVAKGYSYDGILELCQKENEKKCDPPKTKDVVEKEVASLFNWAVTQESKKAERKALKEQERKEMETASKEFTPSVLTKRMRELLETHHENVALAHILNEKVGAEAKEGGEIRYDMDKQSWVVWNGKYWKDDPEGIRVIGLAEDFLFKIMEEAVRLKDKDLIGQILSTQSASGITSAMKLLKPMVAVSTNAFDVDDFIINMQNATYNVDTGEMYPHRKEDFITRISGVDFDPAAECIDWKSHVSLVIPNDETRKAFQIFMGHSLIAGNPENAAMFAYGNGKNGKTVTFSAIDAVLNDYALSAAPATFTERCNDDAPRPDLARMKGARLITIPEGKQGRQLDEGILKNLTGGSDDVTARYLYGREFCFKPTAKLCFHTNHLPKIQGRDNGIWRRIYPVPFTTVVPEEKRIKDYDRILVGAEGSGIFNWLIRGYELYKEQNGLSYPKAIQEARELYKEKEDLLGDFFDYYKITGNPEDIIARNELYKSYKTLCDFDNANGKPFTKGKFNDMVEERIGSPVRHRTLHWVWVGIKAPDYNQKVNNF